MASVSARNLWCDGFIIALAWCAVANVAYADDPVFENQGGGGPLVFGGGAMSPEGMRVDDDELKGGYNPVITTGGGAMSPEGMPDDDVLVPRTDPPLSTGGGASSPEAAPANHLSVTDGGRCGQVNDPLGLSPVIARIFGGC